MNTATPEDGCSKIMCDKKTDGLPATKSRKTVSQLAIEKEKQDELNNKNIILMKERNVWKRRMETVQNAYDNMAHCYSCTDETCASILSELFLNSPASSYKQQLMVYLEGNEEPNIKRTKSELTNYVSSCSNSSLPERSSVPFSCGFVINNSVHGQNKCTVSQQDISLRQVRTSPGQLYKIHSDIGTTPTGVQTLPNKASNSNSTNISRCVFPDKQLVAPDEIKERICFKPQRIAPGEINETICLKQQRIASNEINQSICLKPQLPASSEIQSSGIREEHQLAKETCSNSQAQSRFATREIVTKQSCNKSYSADHGCLKDAETGTTYETDLNDVVQAMNGLHFKC